MTETSPKNFPAHVSGPQRAPHTQPATNKNTKSGPHETTNTVLMTLGAMIVTALACYTIIPLFTNVLLTKDPHFTLARRGSPHTNMYDPAAVVRQYLIDLSIGDNKDALALGYTDPPDAKKVQTADQDDTNESRTNFLFGKYLKEQYAQTPLHDIHVGNPTSQTPLQVPYQFQLGEQEHEGTIALTRSRSGRYFLTHTFIAIHPDNSFYSYPLTGKESLEYLGQGIVTQKDQPNYTGSVYSLQTLYIFPGPFTLKGNYTPFQQKADPLTVPYHDGFWLLAQPGKQESPYIYQLQPDLNFSEKSHARDTAVRIVRDCFKADPLSDNPRNDTPLSEQNTCQKIMANYPKPELLAIAINKEKYTVDCQHIRRTPHGANEQYCHLTINYTLTTRKGTDHTPTIKNIQGTFATTLTHPSQLTFIHARSLT